MAMLTLHRNGPVDGRPLLAIHGITAHGRRFDRLCVEYLPDRHVVAPDLRGHGASLSDTPWNLETHVDDLVEVLDALSWGQVDVMGHSLGGNLALRLLAAHPERVSRVLLLDPAFALPTPFTTTLANGALEDRSFDSVDAMVAADRATRPSAAHAAAEADIRLVATQSADGKWRMPHSRAAVVAMWAELSRALPQVPVCRPTMLVVATQAGLVLDDQRAYLIRELGPDLTTVDLDLGHMLYWEDLETTGRVVADYLGG